MASMLPPNLNKGVRWSSELGIIWNDGSESVISVNKLSSLVSVDFLKRWQNISKA